MRIFLGLLITLQILSGGEPEAVLKETLVLAEEGEIGSKSLESLAISPFCSAEKKKVIVDQWDRLRETIRMSPGGLRIGRSELRGDLAAVGFSVTPPVGVGTVTYHVFGLIKVDGNWKVAPVEGSFANAGLDFSDETQKARVALEDWMARQRVIGLTQTVDEREAVFTKALMEAVDAKTIRRADAKTAVLETVEAIADNQPLQVLRWLGFPEIEEQEENQNLREIVLKGMKEDARRGTWDVLRSPGLLYGLSDPEGKVSNSAVPITIFNPFLPKPEQLQVFDFYVVRDLRRDGSPAGWRVSLPREFLFSEVDFRRRLRVRQWQDPDEQLKRSKGLIKVLSESGPVERVKSPEEAAERFPEFLRNLPLRQLEKWFVWEKGLEEVEPLQDFGESWVRTFQSAGFDKSHTKVFKSENRALLVLASGSDSAPNGVEFHAIKLARDESGWGFFLGSAEGWGKEGVELERNFEESKKGFEAEILAPLTARVAILQADDEPISEQAAADFLKAFRAALEVREVEGVLDLTASLSAEQKQKTVEEAIAMIHSEREPFVPDFEVASVGKGIALGSLAGRPGPGADFQFDVILLVPTDEGLRALISADLWYVSNKAKELRNKAALERLSEALPEEKVQAIRDLLKTHQERVAGEIENTKLAP